jgi:hypothetical protein
MMTKNWSLPWNGGCRCGRLAIRVTAAPILTMACHCRGCQRMSASAYSLTAMFPSSAFAVTQGQTEIGGLHGEHRHFFCSYCKSWVFTRPNGVDQFVNVRPTMFEDVTWFEPFVETYVSEKLPWAVTPAQRSFDLFPAMTDYAALVAAYSAHVSAQN